MVVPLRIAASARAGPYSNLLHCYDTRCRRPGAIVEFLLLALKLSGFDSVQLVRLHLPTELVPAVASEQADISTNALLHEAFPQSKIRYTFPHSFFRDGYYIVENEETNSEEYMIDIVDKSTLGGVIISIIFIAIFCTIVQLKNDSRSSKASLKKNIPRATKRFLRWIWLLLAQLFRQLFSNTRKGSPEITILLLCWLQCSFMLSTFYNTMLQSHFVILKKIGYPCRTIDELAHLLYDAGWKVIVEFDHVPASRYCGDVICEVLKSPTDDWLLVEEKGDVFSTLQTRPKTVVYGQKFISFSDAYDVFYHDSRRKILFVADNTQPMQMLAFGVSRNLSYSIVEKLNRAVTTIYPCFDTLLGRYEYRPVPFEPRTIGFIFSLYHCQLIFLAYLAMTAIAVLTLLAELCTTYCCC